MKKLDLISQGYIPLDKSWHIRMGVLDILDGKDATIKFLEFFANEGKICDDLEALCTASKEWLKGEKGIPVGESGTLYRFLQFADWQLRKGKEFATEGTLTERRKEMCQNPDIVNWPLEELLTLDDETSQWASAAVICAAANDYEIERIETDKYKLNLTYEAVEHWKAQKERKKMWEVRYDDTIIGQALAYLKLLKTNEMVFKPEQAEDYCFARAFGVIKEEDIPRYSKKWKSLHKHESNRIKGMEKALTQYQTGEIIDSKDHRVVHAIAMLANYEDKNVEFEYKSAVNKSWIEFWEFLEDSRKLAK